ncbi:hypothetical protein K443DRAFT_201498 [Laccaria amethystina LaAM-08-1]|uniref:Uncharacterized protein n=1 Tax=Laccaria amethystina LaAM-08-1 TaxID=1095629 RepID=A0A0C9YAG4_9AGAR|nr:hypothetical protein K443DRAFT_201498 [Laccaria amethystina LaAM-08-1]
MVEPQNRTLLQSWTALPTRTRLFLSFGLCVMGATGLIISDYIEKVAPPTTPDQS